MDALDQLLNAVMAGQPLEGGPCSCDNPSISENTITQVVPYGTEGKTVNVQVPVVRCTNCNFSFTDERAAKARHAAVCQASGLLTPEQVKEVRLNLGMTRKEFSDAFGIPPASMERWENGRLMQNRSMDTLLRALQNVAIAHRIARRSEEASEIASGNVIHAAFGELAAKPIEEQHEILDRQRRFTLRVAA